MTPEVPDEHYLWLGRVTAAYGMLDVQIGMLGHASVTGENWTDDWTKVAGRPGMAVDLCSRGLSLMPEELAERTRRLLADAEPLRLERHRLSHSVFVFDPESTGPGAPWSLKHPKGGESPLLDEAHGAELVRALNALSRAAGEIRAMLHTARRSCHDAATTEAAAER